MEWMMMPLRRYADFSGRSRRKEFWMFTLGVTIVSVVLTMLLLGGMDFSTGTLSGGGMIGTLLVALFALAIFIPSLAVQVRRFHDQDKSGWFVLLNLVPYIGSIIVFVMMCLEGTAGPNRFGADPKAGERGGKAGIAV